MSSGSLGRQPWSIVARCDPAEGEIITTHNGDVQILITFFGADVLRQRSEIVAAVKDAAGRAQDGKFLEGVLEAANTSVRAARPLNSNQGASIAIAYQDANHELTSLALGKCQVWLLRGGGVWESATAYPDLYLGESGFNAGRWLAPKKHRVEPGQKPRVMLAPAGYNPWARRVLPGWLTLLAIVVLVGVGWLGMSGVLSPPPTSTSTPVTSQAETPSSSPTSTPEAPPGEVATATASPSPMRSPTGIPIPPTPSPSPTATPLLFATPTATFTPVASQSPEPGVAAGVGITPTITLADIMPQVGSYDSLNFGWTQLGDLTDPYLLEVVVWLNSPGEETPSTDLNCFLTTNCGKGISAPETEPPQNVPLEEVSKRTNMKGLLTRGNLYRWTVFVVIPDDPETPANEYKRITPVNLVGFNGRYPEFEFKRASEEGNERPEPPASPTSPPSNECIPGQNCGGT